MGRSVFLFSALLVGACTASAPADPRAETHARLTKIAAHCGLPAETLRLTGDGLVAIAPSPDTEYAKVDCAITEIEKTDLRQRYAFVGNAPYETGNQN